MTKPKSKQLPPLINQTLENLNDSPPLEVKNQQSLEMLRDLIREAFGNGDLPYGIEGIEHRLLVAAHKARIIYETAPRELAELRTQLESIEALAPDLIGLINSVEVHNLIRNKHWDKTIQRVRENADTELEFELSPQDVAEVKELGGSVFYPDMIEEFPLKSARYGLELLLSAVTEELADLEERVHLSIADRPETEVIAHAIREVQKDAFPDKPNYIGSEGGPIDNLYCFLCDLAGYAPGCSLSTLRKPYSFPEVPISGRFLAPERVFNLLNKKE